MEVAIVGGGIAGLSLALNLHERGIACTVYERTDEMREVGVGITILPHAMRELAALGLQDELVAAGIENEESCFFNRFGQLIYREPRGRHAGYPYPEVGLHRGRLHAALYNRARDRLGANRILTDHECIGVETGETGARVLFRRMTTGEDLPPVAADAVIACDGINSVVRRTFYPGEELAFAGINTWRGVTRREPILGGMTYMRVGSIHTGKMVIYPISHDIDGAGRQLINWVAEIQQDTFTRNDWNKGALPADVPAAFSEWTFDWLDAGALIRDADAIFEYPMVDRDPVDRWTFGRVTLVGDAAHPMYPRGSNGSAQAVIDARVLAECLARHEPGAALRAYEAERLKAANHVVTTNRETPPDIINIRVEELVGDRPFDNLDDYITQDELRELSERYKQVAKFSAQDFR